MKWANEKSQHFMVAARKPDWKIAVLILYGLLVGITVWKHEPWFDEAQAWLLARDANPWELVSRYLRYEGSPGLWHYLLMVSAKLGLPYRTLNILSAVLAVAGTCVFLYRAPFPAVIKLLYPFSYFALYQYAVVARSYSLLPLLLFSIASCHKEKMKRPLLYALLLFLLANVSLHGVIIASALAAIHFRDFVQDWPGLLQSYRIKHLVLFAVFGCLLILLKLQLQPPPDLISVAGFNRDLSVFYPRSLRIFSDALITNLSLHAAENSFMSILTAVFGGIVIVLSLFWFMLRKKLLHFLTPAAGLFLLFTLVYAHVWHQGVIFYLWLFVLWLSYSVPDEASLPPSRVVKPVVTTAVACVLAVQTLWSAGAVRYDYTADYSASRAAATYIRDNHLAGAKIYASNFHSIALLPYFDRSIFCNYRYEPDVSFWIWSRQNTMYKEPYLNLEKYDPEYILLGVKNYTPGGNTAVEPYARDIPGYTLLKGFNGGLYWKDRVLETDSFLLYKKQRGGITASQRYVRPESNAF